MTTKEKKGGFFSMLKGHSKAKDISDTPKKSSNDTKDSSDTKSVKRRDSAKLPSASKLLRSLRPDRTSPAYHSEGKGLRKRKQAWASERDLPESGKKSAERSRSFSERPNFESIQDLSTLTITDSSVSEFENSATEKSIIDHVFNDSDDLKKKKKEIDIKRERQERKLTKDSGYETSNSDYANPDTLKSIREVENSTESIYANLQELQEGVYSARETNFFGNEEDSPKSTPETERKQHEESKKSLQNDTTPNNETNAHDRLSTPNDDECQQVPRVEPIQVTRGMTGSKSTPNLDVNLRNSDSSLTRSDWDWSNTDEEYASQLRSVLLGHNRQPSSLSSSSSHSRQISSVSDEGVLSSSDQRSRPLSESLSHLSASSGGDRYFSFDHLDDVGLPHQWDPIPISPLHRSPPPPPVRDMSSLKYARSQSQTHEKYPSWPMPQGEPVPQSQRSKSWTEHTEYQKEPIPMYTRLYSRRPLPMFNQQLKPVIENLSHEHYESSPVPSPDPPSSISRYTDPDYARYDDLRSYSQSEGYSSYVSSEASYVSNGSGTPFLDRLRLESEVVRHDVNRSSPSSVTGRDSVTTVVTNSSSSSSNDTQKIHSSYSDLSAYNMLNRHGVAHSSRVQLPQRHNSESVLFYSQDNKRPEAKSKPHLRNRELCDEDPMLRSPVVDTSKLAPVSERIFQLERQSKSVPNLMDKSPNKPVRSPHKENLAYLDPEKKLQVAEPTLKQIQKQALMNYYERKVTSKMRFEFRKQASYDGLSNYQNVDVLLREESERKAAFLQRQQDNYANAIPSHNAHHLKGSEGVVILSSSTFSDIESQSDGSFIPASAELKSMQPPERPPKKPHMRPLVQHLSCSQRAAPQQPVGSSNNSLPSPSHAPCSVAKKPPAPEPLSRPDVESRIPPYHGRCEYVLGKNNSPRRNSNELGKVRDILEDDPPPALPARISPTFCEPISGSFLKPPAFQGPPPVLPARLSPLGIESRPMTPDLPPPPPPPIVSSDGALEDEPLPPPPSPLLSKENNKESYSEIAGEVTSPVICTDNFTSLDLPGAPMNWEKLHNLRSNGTTVVFTSEELAKIKEKHKMVQKLATESTYRSEIIIYPSNDQVQLEILAKKQNIEDLNAHSIVSRSKGLEEIECDKLTIELAKQLPESDKLKTLLGGTDVKTAFDYVDEIFGLGTVNIVSKNYSYSAKNDTEPIENGEVPEARSPRRSLSPLADNPVYLISSSEPKTELLTQYSDDNEKINTIPVDTDSLLQKKEDLVKRLDKKLEILRLERQAIHEDISSNEKLGKEVSSRVAEVATSGERNKVALHVIEVEKITALLLGLAGRLARAQNALASLGEVGDSQEKMILESKRDKLIEQLDEARVLKLSIEKRSRNVSTLLQKYFTEEEYADYEHFVTMKAKLAVDAREIEEKIKLGEEQLLALKETLSGNLGPIL